jgi:hypothetical protein
MLPIDFTRFAEKWSSRVAMSRRFRVKEVIRHGIASVTRVRMTNADAGREGAAGWKSEMKLFRVEDRTLPRAPMRDCNWRVGIVDCVVTCFPQCLYLFRD